MHYRVTRETNRTLEPRRACWCSTAAGNTSTAPPTSPAPCRWARSATIEKAAFTRVLQGMIAISRVRFPKGLAGRDLDPLARYPLWLAHHDFNHGTGHGVGSYLSRCTKGRSGSSEIARWRWSPA